MNEGLDYAQMLEIPVSTVSVVKKKPFFRRRAKREEDLKDKVVESVNDRVSAEDEAAYAAYDGAYIATEELARPEGKKKGRDSFTTKFLIAEGVAACLIAAGIFFTNMLVPNTAINAFMGGLTAVPEEEAAYYELPLSPVVSELSDAEVSVSADGVISFTDEASVYPVCDGEVASVTSSDGLYTVKIAHTSTFSSVVMGLSSVYVNEGEEIASNLPMGYSDGQSEVRVSMYDGDTLLNCYTLSGVVPVWNQ